ncbi:ABC transporter substrate-binding protein [Virgibacillus salexigens]|uniref:Sugar ABC transporter substrate-binding protein n=1 Tax=Virgibacillus kapii TaxID=1638645 RepID=A0ABQ2DAG3_9BACI|nr:sugar ABC transporter substrate-binding protein [Virgibacillus kapii]GGJ51628.1 sugar ABC transporter substrate-binding protein [Virgibacillus kapii]
MRRVWGIIILLGFLIAVSACSQEEDATADGDSTITYAYWDKNQEDMLKGIVQEFNQEYPNIHVKLELTPYDQYFTKLDAAATGGGLPDVFWMNGPNFVKYASNDMLEPINEYIEEDNLDLSPYPEGLLGLYQYEKTTYALPKDYDTVGLWYNKELFDKAGVSYPDETWKWEDLVDASQKLTNPDKDIYGVAAYIQDAQASYFNTILANNGYVISEDKKESGFDDPNTIEGLQKYHDLIHKHEVSPTHAQMETTEAASMFESGKVAMLFQASYMIPQFKANEYTNANVDVALLPEMKKRANVIHGLGNVIAKNSANKAAAWEFVKFLSSEKAATMQAESGIIPAYEGTQDAWLKSTPNFNLQAFLDMAEVAEPYPVSKDTDKWSSIIQDNLAKAWSGQMTVEEASEVIDKEMEKVLEEE